MEWLFPPCHRAVSGTLITPCEGSPLDPDLVITELSHSPASPEAGESVDATLRVRNLGPAVAPNTRFRLRFSGGGVTRESVLWVGSLASGAERSFVVRSLDSGFGVALGSNRIEVTVDSHDELLEGREDNNYKEISFIGVSASTSGIDFRIRDLDFSPQHPVERERVTVTFDTVNSGSLAASETKVRLAVLDPTGNYVVNELVPVDALEAMTSREEEFSFVGWAPGLYSLVVTMDPTEEVAESREENNSFFVTVDFAEEALCLPCTSGAPNNEVGATLCLEHSNPVFPPSAGAQWICRGVRADGSTCVPSGNHPNGWGFHQPRCPDSASLPPGWHPDVCGNVGICPGLGTAP
ncbi:MAG: CARDB domain-containing protein [Acidobacteriota bacterium]